MNYSALHVYRGARMTIADIASRIHRSPRCVRRRLEKCKERGWPPEYAFINKKWPQTKQKYRIECPDGEIRSPFEVGKMLEVSAETIRKRVQRLRKEGKPDTDIFNSDRWYKKKAEVKLTEKCLRPNAREQAILDSIPAPSELERRVFG